MSTRRNIFIRSITSVAGDVAIGYAMASACLWIIQSAALGLFLSFLLWLLTIALALAISQHALHPAVSLLLSDRKLDNGIDALTLLVKTAADLGAGYGLPIFGDLPARLRRFAKANTAK